MPLSQGGRKFEPPKFYVRCSLPSGTLHIGHIRNYSIGDALARYEADARIQRAPSHGLGRFRLRENAAIANQRDPREWTQQNITAMKRTHSRFAFSYGGTARSHLRRAAVLPLEPVVLP
jgi:leucyl-tRNA synthetase